MLSNPTQRVLSDPKGLDYALEELNTKMGTSLTWLTNKYGLAQILSQKINATPSDPFSGGVFTFPGIYIGENEYLSMMPDSHLGNYSWILEEDGSEISWIDFNLPSIEYQVSIIFWFDMRDVYPADYDTRSIENVKADLYSFFSTAALLRSTITINRAWTRPDNVYSEFDIDQLDNQFLMFPYQAIRLDCSLVAVTQCS